MKNLIVHIGLHKTGTTFLQENLFPNLPNCLVVRGFHSHRALFSKLLKQHVILSDEGIAGNVWAGNFQEEFELNIERIKMLYNDPLIVLGIRQQVDWLPSLYKQHLHQKSTDDLDVFFNTNNTGILKVNDLLLMPKIKLVKDSFQKVFVYSQKTLLERQGDFVKSFLDFIGEDHDQYSQNPTTKRANVGVKSKLQVNSLIFMNRINKVFERIHPQLSLYHPILRYLHLTPRNFAQTALRGIPSQKFEIDTRLSEFLCDYYNEDWVSALNHVSYGDRTRVPER